MMNPDFSPEPDDDIADPVEIANQLAGHPAIDDILNSPFTPFATPEHSQQEIKKAIDYVIERDGLSPAEVHDRVKNELARNPSVTLGEIVDFTPEVCARYVAEGLPVDDSIYISAFQSALRVQLTDL